MEQRAMEQRETAGSMGRQMEQRADRWNNQTKTLSLAQKAFKNDLQWELQMNSNQIHQDQ